MNAEGRRDLSTLTQYTSRMSEQGTGDMLVVADNGIVVWLCNVCGGEVEVLGVLGTALWGRCVDCGFDQHRPLDSPPG